MENVVSAIKNATEDNKYVVIGELHGVRENVLVLERLLTEDAIDAHDAFAFAFEWPFDAEEALVLSDYVAGRSDKNEIQYQNVIDTLYQQQSGVFSDQHASFLQKVRDVNGQRDRDAIKIIVFDSDLAPWNEREKQMADNVIKQSENVDLVIVVTGDLHARKQPFRLDGSEDLYKPLAFHLPEEQTFSVKLQYKGGQFYNFGVQDIYPSNDKEDNDEQYYDAVFELEKAMPVTITP